MDPNPPLSFALLVHTSHIGSVTWLGGARLDLQINADASTRKHVEDTLAPFLARPPWEIGAALHAFFAGPSESALGFSARHVTITSSESYQRNKARADFSPGAVLAATKRGEITWAPAQGGGFKAGFCTLAGTDIWLTISKKDAGFVLIRTEGTTSIPSVVFQAGGVLFWKSPLAKLMAVAERNARPT